MITYEHPLNEQYRHFLQLEYYFQLIGKSLEASHASATLVTIQSFIHIIEILERSPIQSEITQALQSKKNTLEALQEHPNVDPVELDKTLANLLAHLNNVRSMKAKVPSVFKSDSLLLSIRKKYSGIATAYPLDLPKLSYFLQLSEAKKAQTFSPWLIALQPIQQACEYILTLTRNSSDFQAVTSNNGLFQHALGKTEHALIRLKLALTKQAYPEISANKYQINIRFFQAEDLNGSKQISEDLRFDIAYCII